MSPAPFLIHNIDPVLADLGGIRVWYYGLAYAVGFLGISCWLRRRQGFLGWRVDEVHDLSLLLAISILISGHVFEIVMYEWPYYRAHPWQMVNYWNGGMSTHGVLLGAILGTWAFCRRRGKHFLEVADVLAIPAAVFMGVGRLGNFINGENYGPITSVPWAVKFPYAEGFRHPVDLYDSLKNVAIVLILLATRKACGKAKGMLLAQFVFWYGALRLAIDLFREYGTDFLGIGRGQYFNLVMAGAGLALMVWCAHRSKRPGAAGSEGLGAQADDPPAHPSVFWARKAGFALIVSFALTIPSGWSQGWLQQLKDRHTVQGISRGTAAQALPRPRVHP